MSAGADHGLARFRGGAAVLLICLALPLADGLSRRISAEMAALLVFLLLFLAWLTLGLVVDAWGRAGVTETGNLELGARAD